MARRPRRAVVPVAEPGACSGLALDAVLDLNATGPLCAALLERRGSDLALDASSVRHLGALCAQVLASAASTWAADGRALAVRTPSQAFTEATRLLGLGAILIPEGISA